MFSKELRELDRNTVLYMIDEMQDELDQKKIQLQDTESKLNDAHTQLNSTQDELQSAQDKLHSTQDKLYWITADITAFPCTSFRLTPIP